MRFLARVFLVLLVSFDVGQASCGSASCPLNNHRYSGAGIFRLSLTHEYINQNLVYAGADRTFVGSIREDHDEVQTINQRTVAQMQLGISDRFALSADIPLISRQHSHIQHTPSGDVLESWDFSGLGDVVINGEYALLLPHSTSGPYLSLIGGIKLPTGAKHQKNSENEEAEVTIQPGTGSTDGLVGIVYRQTVASVSTLSGDYSALPIIAGASFQYTGTGTYGWRFGNTLLAHVGTSYQFSENMNLLLQVNARFQGFADVGSTGEPRENTGGTWIFASPGLRVNFLDKFSAYGYVQIPVYENVHGIQQTSRYNLQFGISADLSFFD